MKPRSVFSLNSVRMRLTLWNVAALALALAGLGIIFILSFQATVGAAVSQRLSQRAHRDQWLFAHPPPFRLPRSRHFSLPPSAGEANSFGELRSRFFDSQGRSIDGFGRPNPSLPSPWEEAGLARALHGEEAYATVKADGQDVRVLSFPLLRGGHLYGAGQVGNSLALIAEDQTRMVRTLWTLIPLVLVIAGVGGAFLTDRALRPVRQIAHAAGKIETENLSRRLPVVGNDEFADLADTFNGMLSRLQRGFERQEEAFEQQRRFTA
ncbi:MAG: HAMP domain-containing protein, partial [Armatimonadota bacterium]|nr:HAMP domain-containing protein [Armatimonadota bacterium]